MIPPVDEVPEFKDPAHELEWQAQQAGRRGDFATVDPEAPRRDWEYRVIDLALRTSGANQLPADFAMRVAAQARASFAYSRVDFAVMAFLLLVLMVSAVLAVLADQWSLSEAMGSLLQMPAGGCLLVCSGCLGASWLVGYWKLQTDRFTVCRFDERDRP